VLASPEAWNVASRKTAVSKPSRSTARKAIITRARLDPSASAEAAAPWRSFFMLRACLRMNTTM
jgi:hypothetical protein